VGNNAIGNWHLHVFKSVQRGFEIHVFDVGSSEVGVQGAKDTVPQDFGRNHVSCVFCEFEWVIDWIASHSYSYMVRVFLLEVMINHDASISDCPVFWDEANFCV
jgi:hypothetical protein